MDQKVSKDLLRALSAAIDVTPMCLSQCKKLPERICVMEKVKHEGFMGKVMSLSYFSEVILSFLEKNQRNNATQDIILSMENTPGTGSWCYVENNQLINVLHVPSEKKSANKPIIVKITRFEILYGAWVKSVCEYKVPFRKCIFNERKVSKTIEPDNMYRCPKMGLYYPPCSQCFTTKVKTKKCSRCSLVHYCGTKCQRKDWKTHKNMCNKAVTLPKCETIRDIIILDIDV